MDEFIGIIKIFAGNYAPQGWALCNGQLLNINQYQALFAILGNVYGGDGRTTFALPDLRGRFPIGAGNGPGLPPYTLGAVGGAANVTLTQNQMPAHTHMATASITIPALADDGGTNSPGPNTIFAAGPSASTIYSTSQADTNLKPFSTQVNVQLAGGSLPVNVSNPYVGINYIICLDGIFPPRS